MDHVYNKPLVKMNAYLLRSLRVWKALWDFLAAAQAVRLVRNRLYGFCDDAVGLQTHVHTIWHPSCKLASPAYSKSFFTRAVKSHRLLHSVVDVHGCPIFLRHEPFLTT